MNLINAVIENCMFLDNQRFKVLTLLNVARGQFYNTFDYTNLIFNNITVADNLGDHVAKGSQSLFSFYSPLKPLNIIFNSSLFENNVISKICLH